MLGGQRHNNPQQSLPAADIRHGLRTPPGDMSGMSVNPLLAPNLGASQYKSVPAAVWNGAARQGSVGSRVDPRSTDNPYPSQTVFHNRSRSHENPATQKNGLKEPSSKARGEIHDSSIVSYLQIPSSINGSKGSLAEFAAQVCEAGVIKAYIVSSNPDHLFVLVRIFFHTTLRRRVQGHAIAHRTARFRSYTDNGVSEMGRVDLVNHAGFTECHPTGFDVHLPPQKTQPWSQG